MIDLTHATPEEVAHYEFLLRKELAMVSPLDLALLMFPDWKAWPHLVLLNEHLLALVEYRLTISGPKPAENIRWWYRPINSSKREPALGPHHIPEQEEIKGFGAYDVESGEEVLFQLAVSMMPRAGKSRLITEVFPVWLLLQDPDMQIGVGTYSDTFAADWGETMRNRMIEHAEGDDSDKQKYLRFLPYPEGGARAARDVFKVQGAQGKVRFTGTGGAVTGKTLHVLIGDDFLKNDQEAQSEADRAQMQRFLDTTWKTRKTRNMTAGCYLPIPVEVLMATRWHQADPIGYRVFDPETHEQYPDWCYLNIPALATEGPEGDPLGRQKGAAHANAAGYSQEGLEELRAKDPATFSALYQGSPSVEGGGLLSTEFRSFWSKEVGGETWLFWQTIEGNTAEGGVPLTLSVPLSECIVFAAADMAATKKTASDYTVLGVFAYSREHKTGFILDWYRERITTDQYMTELTPLLQEYGVATTAIENVTYGQMFGQALEAQRYQTEMMDATQDKVARLVSSGVSNMIRRGALRAPRGAAWIGALKNEAGIFPKGEHDDQVDVLSFAGKFISELPDWRPPVVRKQLTIVEEIEAQVLRQQKAKGRSRSRDPFARLARR